MTMYIRKIIQKILDFFEDPLVITLVLKYIAIMCILIALFVELLKVTVLRSGQICKDYWKLFSYQSFIKFLARKRYYSEKGNNITEKEFEHLNNLAKRFLKKRRNKKDGSC